MRRKDEMMVPRITSVLKTKKILSIESFRGVAATLVVLTHANLFLTLSEKNDHYSVLKYGTIGVDFFFVLSGYIIFYAHYTDIGRGNSFQRFVWRRWSRVYPIYFILTLAVISMKLAYHPFSAHITNTFTYYLSSFLMYPYSDVSYPIISPAWSLFHEILFYAFFGLIILNSFWGALIFVFWNILIVMCYTFNVNLVFPFSQILHLVNIEFVFGIAAFFIGRNLRKPKFLLILGMCFVAVFIIGNNIDADLFWKNQLLRRLVLSISFAFLIAGMSAFEKRANRFYVPKLLVMIGTASYSIYLIHFPLFEVLYIVKRRFNLLWLSGGVYIFTQVILALVLGIIVHICIEAPLINAIKHSRINKNINTRYINKNTPSSNSVAMAKK